MTISLALANGLSGINASQAVLASISQNVANANTAGYSRQVVELEQQVINGRGVGVQVSAVKRVVDQFLVRELRTQISSLGSAQAIETFFAEIQARFGTPGGNTTFGADLARFTTTLETLSANPEDPALRFDVVAAGDTLARNIKEFSEAIQRLRAETDKEIKASIADINTRLVEVDLLNAQISKAVIVGAPTADFADMRDRSIYAIAKQLDIRTFTDASQQISILAGGSISLLDNELHQISYSPAATVNNATVFGAITISAVNRETLAALGAAQTLVTRGVSDVVSVGALETKTIDDITKTLDNVDAFNVSTDGTFTINGTAAANTIAYDVSVDTIETLAAKINAKEIAGVTASVVGGAGTTAKLIINSTIDPLIVTHASGGNLVSAAAFKTHEFDIVTTTTKSGRLSGLLNVRDGTLSKLADQIESLTDTMRTEFNRVHNTGSPFPARNTLTGTRIVAPADTFEGTGKVRIAVLNKLGDLVAIPVDLDLAALGSTTVNTLITTINATLGSTATAAVVNNVLTITATNKDHSIAINENTSDVKGKTKAFSHFFGLNDFFVGDSAGVFSVRADILADPGLISTGELSLTAVPGKTALTVGNNRSILNLAGVSEKSFTFLAVGGLPAGTFTLGDYAGSIVGLNAVQAANANARATLQTSLFENLSHRAASQSGVNIDEEMANLIVFQNAFAASAQVMSTASEMFDLLLSLSG